MNLHRNAKTSPRMRQLIIDRVDRQGWTQRQVAEAAGVSVRTVAKWQARARRGDTGPSGRRVAATPVAAPAVGRRHRHGARAAAAPRHELGNQPARRRAVLDRDPRVGARWVEPLRWPEPKPVVQRYEWPHAGDLVHLDIKPLGRIRGVGHRIHGDRRTRQRGIGWEYAHVAIDDATRLAYVEVRRSQRRRACDAFLRHALQWFALRGIRVRRILTDNGSGYRSRRVARACRVWQLRHKRTRPYTPRTNGKAERFIQTLLREWAYRWAYLTSTARTKALAQYVRHYKPSAPSCEPWPSIAVDSVSGGRLMNNVMGIHT